jgi:hypothetical protein
VRTGRGTAGRYGARERPLTSAVNRAGRDHDEIPTQLVRAGLAFSGQRSGPRGDLGRTKQAAEKGGGSAEAKGRTYPGA